MYTPRYDLNFLTSQAAAARLVAANRARLDKAARQAAHSTHDDEAGARWRMLGVVAVVAIIALGAVVAVWVV